jgi:hypothetical protein
MRSLTAYCENANRANISQGNVTREKSRNMMLACGWITAVENRQSKAGVEVRSREKDEVSGIREGPTASPAHMWKEEKGKEPEPIWSAA